MGYLTKYDLKISGGEFITEEVEAQIAESLNRCAGYGEHLYNELVSGYQPDIKWYDHHEDLLGLSTEYPQYLFTLSGEGEESGDLWKKYYTRGKYQLALAKITFDPFDELELK